MNVILGGVGLSVIMPPVHIVRSIKSIKKFGGTEMDQLKREQLQLLPYQEKSIQSLTARKDYYLYLASITKHSKKRKRHLDGAQFYDEVIADAYEEYAEMNGEMEI